MDINDIKYSGLKAQIELLYDQYQDWDKIKTLGIFPFDANQAILMIGSLTGISTLTVDEWESAVDELQRRDKLIKVIKLSQSIKSNAKISAEKNSSWQLYKQRLVSQGFTEKSIDNIKKSSFEILQNLSMDNSDDGAVKGLVIGNVQSGKTANMAGLMAMAADNGFNYFIILSGVIENLRQQTATRLYSDMNTSGTSTLRWKQIDRPSPNSRKPEHDISNFDLSIKSRDRYFTVSLKNKSRLKALIDWISKDKKKAKQLKILVIDDEADQASINTKPIEEEDRTAINEQILRLVNSKSFAGMNYIAYTATPYANVLNDTSKKSLYPKDFIVVLEQSEDYIGPTQLFGTEEPERSPYLEIVREIPDSDKKIVKELQEGKMAHQLPQSFVKSIHWFLLTVAAMRELDYRKPITMLVHTSFKISHHKNIADKIAWYLKYLKVNFKNVLPQIKEMYEDESLDFRRSTFLDGMPNYSSSESVPDYPTWESVEKHLVRFVRLEDGEYVTHIPIGEEGLPKYHKGIHLAIDNSRSKAEDQIIRLVYPTKNQAFSVAPAFIVIGGNTLSRGLTLEGLTTTFFLRTTNQADTLMQMGRWFGYRKGYEIFPRVWLDRLALERFQFLSQMNDEFRNEIEGYAEKGLTPSGYAPKIKNSANYKLIRITSANKMQAAQAIDYDFIGFNTQTIYFENNLVNLNQNLAHTEQFLNSLDKPEIKDKYIIWRDVSVKEIISFLREYSVYRDDTKMSSLPALIKWASENSDILANWSVILSSKGEVAKSNALPSIWNIHGYNPQPVLRTKLKNRSSDTLANIGALRSPTDLFADIEDELLPDEKKAAKPSLVYQIREKHNYGSVPQLIIYRIDKGEMDDETYHEKNKNHEGRTPLNFPADIIGINILIPGETKRGNRAKYISAKLDLDNQMVDETEFAEDGDEV